jgi:hypothetical protein
MSTSMTTIMLGQLKNHVQKVIRNHKNDQSIVIVDCDFSLDFRKDCKNLLKKTTAWDSNGVKYEIVLDL